MHVQSIFILSVLLLFSIQQVESKEILIPAKPDTEPEEIIRKVLDNAQIEKNSEEDPLKDCPVTAQFRIDSFDRQTHETWKIQALDLDGNEKTIGGDEFYLTYHHKSLGTTSNHYHAAASIQDYRNGKYSLMFKTPPMTPDILDDIDVTEGGILTLTYTYACDMADLTPPTKRTWENGGFINKVYQIEIDHAPPVRKFEVPKLPAGIKPFDYVLGVGDSLMRHFAGEWYWSDDHLRSNGSFMDRFGAPLNMETVDKYIKLIDSGIKSRRIQHRIHENNLLVVLGSGIWDVTEDEQKFLVQSKSFSSHREAIFYLIRHLTRKYENQPVQFVWKSITATHPCVLFHGGLSKAITRTKYATTTRSTRLYRYQKRIMRELGIPVLDMYEATYLSKDYHIESDHNGIHHTDTAHYSAEFNEKMWNWFFPEDEGDVISTE